MDITCITATCEGREPFLELCRTYVSRFTLQPKEHFIEKSDDFRANLAALLKKVKTEYVAFIEDDDWYHPDYLGDLGDRLDYSARLLIGLDPTTYYHIVRRGFKTLPHWGRASLFATMGVTSFVQMAMGDILKTKNPVDMSLWAMAKGSGVTTVGRLAIGVKHGFTRTEGKGHTAPPSFWKPDEDGAMLRKWIGTGDYHEYQKLIKHYKGEEDGNRI